MGAGMLNNIKDRLLKLGKKRKKGAMSMMFVIGSLAALVLFTSIIYEYSNIIIVRTFESAADLAAVEALRTYIDEDSLRNEDLQLATYTAGDDNPDCYDEGDPKCIAVRDLFLQKIRESMPSHSAKVL